MMAKLYTPNKESLITFVVLSLILHGLIYSFPSDMFLKAPEYPEPVIQVSIISEAAPASVSNVAEKVSEEPVKQETVKAEPVKKEPIKKEIVKKEPVKKQEIVKQQPIKQSELVKATYEEYRPVNLNSLQPASYHPEYQPEISKDAAVQTYEQSISTQSAPASENASLDSPTSNDNGKQAVTVAPMLSPADYVQTSLPHYPKRAIDRGIQGTVIVKALINSYGTAEDLKISSSSGHEMLDDSAIKAVSKWRFKPSILAGHAQEMWVQVPVKFVIR